MDAAVAALLRAFPDRLDVDGATAWVAARVALLTTRCAERPELALAVSSGCAATGAHTHATALAAAAAHALRRLEAGLVPLCESCGEVLAFERLDAAPDAVRCTGCVPTSTVDTRWCR